MPKLRIKVDYQSKLQWMFCDLNNIQTVGDLENQIKERYELKRFELLLDDAILPDFESVEILNNGDVVKVNVLKKLKKVNEILKIKQEIIEEPPSPLNQSSESSDENEAEQFEQSFTQINYVPKKIVPAPTPEIKSEKEESEVKSEKKRKRKRKNKNKNKLVESEEAKVIENAEPIIRSAPSHGKITKFNDDDEVEQDILYLYGSENLNSSIDNDAKHYESNVEIKTNGHSNVEKNREIKTHGSINEKTKKKLALSSPQISCEDMMLDKAENNSPKAKSLAAPKISRPPNLNGRKIIPENSGTFDALLKLADKPLTVKKAQKQAANDIYASKSVVLKNIDATFGDNNLEEIEIFEGNPEIGQTFAFKCLQIAPDYTPQMTQYVGKVVSLDGEKTKFFILFDENEKRNDGTNKFEVETISDGFILKNQEVDFHWSQLSEIKLIETDEK